MNNNRLLSTMREFAHDIHSSMPTVYKEIARGNLQTIKIGKRRFVTAEQRADYIRKKEAEASWAWPTKKMAALVRRGQSKGME